MAIYSFGSGVLLGQRTDVAGVTPVNFGLVQEVELDFQFTTKELCGQDQFPLAISRGQAKAQATPGCGSSTSQKKLVGSRPRFQTS